MKKLALPLVLCLLCVPAFAADYSHDWTEDFSWGAWDDGTGTLDYTSSDLYQGSNSRPYRIFFLHADESTGGACNMAMIKTGVFVIDDEQVAGNWTDSWGDSSRTTCVQHVYDDPTGQGAESVVQVGVDYFDLGRGGLESMSPMRVESDIYDPDYEYQLLTEGYTDLDHVVTAPLANGHSYVWTREAVNVNGDIYAVAYMTGDNATRDDQMVADKANLMKLTYSETAGGWTMDAHADMSNSSSPWYGGIDLSQDYTDSVTGDGISLVNGLSVWDDKIYLAGQNHGLTGPYGGENGDAFTTAEGAPILELDPATGTITELGRLTAANMNAAEDELQIHQVCRYGNEIFLVNNTAPTSCAYWAELDETTGLIDNTTWQSLVIADYVGGAAMYDDGNLESHGIAATGDGTEATGFWVTATGKVSGTYSPSVVFFEKDAEQIKGDIDNDGDVDASDFAYLSSNWQAGTANWGGGTPMVDPVDANEIAGDIDRDGDVDASDFAWLSSNWQYGTANWPGGDPASVPEPGTIALLLGGALCLLIARRRK